jgi:hypothetical protein
MEMIEQQSRLCFGKIAKSKCIEKKEGGVVGLDFGYGR